MPNVLIVGATRGLGSSLAKQYASNSSTTVHGTSRKPADTNAGSNIKWIGNVDIGTASAGPVVVRALQKDAAAPAATAAVDIVVITAGYFATETLAAPKWDDEVTMYTTSAIGPVFLVSALVGAGLLKRGSKVILVSSESGSIALRHEKEGGGNYAHHASKAALNMVGKLLSLDLKEEGVAVASVHPGFMRTEMTKGVGFDKYWDDGGAVTPDEAAKSLIEWIETFDMSKTGEYWAPRGPRDIGTADVVMGPKDKLPTPLQLPW